MSERIQENPLFAADPVQSLEESGGYLLPANAIDAYGNPDVYAVSLRRQAVGWLSELVFLGSEEVVTNTESSLGAFDLYELLEQMTEQDMQNPNYCNLAEARRRFDMAIEHDLDPRMIMAGLLAVADIDPYADYGSIEIVG